MIDFVSATHNEPFAIALLVLVGLFLCEVFLFVFGLSSDLGIEGSEAGETGLEPVPVLSPAEIDLVDPAALADGDTSPVAPEGFSGLLVWLGLGGVPSLVWLGAFCLGFSLSGYAVQLIALTLLAPLPSLVAAIPAAIGGILTARILSRWIGFLIPSVETYVTSGFNRRRGYIVIGTAKRNHPAQVSYKDSYGTERLIMAEPLSDKDEISGGTEVLILRDRQNNPRVVSLSS